MEEKTQIFSGRETIKLVKQLIRYDIPFVMLGISSIGKSYSILDMAKRWRMPHSILYIGSEKPSNIEGLPRLVGKRSETGDILEFFKPNWFPNSLLVSKYVTNGKKVFENFVNKAYKGSKKGVLDGSDFNGLNEIFEGIFQWRWESNTTETQDMVLPKIGTAKDVLNKPFKVSRELLDEKELFVKTTEDPNFMQKDEVRDMSLYLSTILGYGNFWLILDELDKVDEAEQDKYAPLLHIVRERIIKNFSMRTLNEGEGAGVPMKVDKGSYKNIKQSIDNSIDKKFPLLDTRIIGIANATANIEEALFRRFLHIIIEEVMMVSDPPKQLADMRNCLSTVTSNVMGGGNQFLENLEFKLLQEVNLQWQFNFFPKLINRNDGQNNYIVRNLQMTLAGSGISDIQGRLESDKSVASNMLFENASDSALFKIVRNNYGIDDEMGGGLSNQFQAQIYGCLVAEVLQQGGAVESIVSEGAKAADVGSDELVSNANAEAIQEALEMVDGDSLKAAQYLIAENLREYTEMEKNNAAIIGYVTSTLQLIESSKGTSVESNLFTGLICNAYAAVIFSAQTIDFKLTTSTYINQFSLFAQEDGFSYSTADDAVTKTALTTLELDVDTLKAEMQGKSQRLVKFNETMALNTAMIFKKDGQISQSEPLKLFLNKFKKVGVRGLDVQWQAFNAIFTDAVVGALEKKGVKKQMQDRRN